MRVMVDGVSYKIIFRHSRRRGQHFSHAVWVKDGRKIALGASPQMAWREEDLKAALRRARPHSDKPA
jgi:hypothetical protein